MNSIQSQNMSRFLQGQRNKETLHVITCGSVDDGKSTLIDRLLLESQSIFDNQLQALEDDPRQYGTQGEKMDLALLVDGLHAERERGITIDAAYRFLTTEKRRYTIIDAPSHEQYTRDLVASASTADLAVILVDARKGLLTQTRWHSRTMVMMGICHVVLAVNKMDLVAFNQAVFDLIAQQYHKFAAGLGFSNVQVIPISSLNGDNVLRPSPCMPWYDGPSLLSHLDSVEVRNPQAQGAMRLPVQWVNQPTPDFRGLCGRLAAWPPAQYARATPYACCPRAYRHRSRRCSSITLNGNRPIAARRSL